MSRCNENDRVTVGRGACDFAPSHGAAAAGVAIFDNDPLPERVVHFVSDGAGHNIVGAAGRQRDDENNGAARIIGGFARRADEESGRHSASQRAMRAKPFATFPPALFLAEPGTLY